MLKIKKVLTIFMCLKCFYFHHKCGWSIEAVIFIFLQCTLSLFLCSSGCSSVTRPAIQCGRRWRDGCDDADLLKIDKMTNIINRLELHYSEKRHAGAILTLSMQHI